MRDTTDCSRRNAPASRNWISKMPESVLRRVSAPKGRLFATNPIKSRRLRSRGSSSRKIGNDTRLIMDVIHCKTTSAIGRPRRSDTKRISELLSNLPVVGSASGFQRAMSEFLHEERLNSFARGREEPQTCRVEY